MKKSTVITAAVLAATTALGTTQVKADDVKPVTQPANPTAETQAQSQVTAKQVADAKAKKEAAEQQNTANQVAASNAEQAKQAVDTNAANTQKQVTEAEKAAAEATPEKIAETEAGKKAAEDALNAAKTEQAQKQADLDATRAATKPATEAVQSQEKEVSNAQDNVKAAQTEKATADVAAAQAEANAQAKSAVEKVADKEVAQAKDKVSQAEAAKTEAEKAQANQAAAIEKAEKDVATKKDYFSISTMDGLEKITNLLLKLMLSDLRFQNIFMKHHFLEEKEEPFSEDDFAQFEKENKKLQEWYSKDVGDMVSKIAADPEDWTWLKHTFLTKKALLCDKCFSYFDEQLRELFRSRESYEAKEFFGDKLSNILFKRLSFKHIMKIICSDRMRLYLHELVHYSALDSNSNFFHTRFPHYYQRQKLFMELLVQMKEGNVVSDETYTEYRLQSDIVTLLDKNLITDNAEVLSDTLHSLQLFSIVYPEAADALVE